jgi:protein-disulfide isomerase
MPVLGSADAPVTILEFSDYQCPYCRQYVRQTLPKILATYVETGQVRYLFKDFPLDSHPNAQKAAEAARCAGTQGAYWAMHGRLFDAQREWVQQGQEEALEKFVRYAEELGLDAMAFRECLQSGQFGEQIRQDQWEGQQAGVRGTPSFLINGQLLTGAHPFETFQQMIEAELRRGP